MPHQHCLNLADIAQEKSQAKIEQKDKLVRNNDIVHACLNFINFCILSRLFLFFMFPYLSFINHFCLITFHTRSFSVFVRDFPFSGFCLKF